MTKIDISTILGLAIAVLLVLVSLHLSGDISNFINFPAVLVTFGCTIAVSCASFSFSDMWTALKTVLEIAFFSPAKSELIAYTSIKSAELAAQNGTLNINIRKDLPLNNKFFKKWLEFVSDGEKIEVIDRLITQEIYTFQDQQNTVIKLLRKAAEVAPAFGLIGTLIGLVQMLSNIEDISVIGKGMSIALLTTFYGAILAYMFLIPIATKIERNVKEEVMNLKIMHRTILAITGKENPRQLETVLNSILPQGRKVIYYKY